MNKQSAFNNEESHENIVKENEEEKHKELKRKRNCERQRAHYQRQKDLKKNEEKKDKKKVPKTNAERQRAFRQRNAEKRRKLCSNEENVVQVCPLMLLFERLISNDSKSNTVLTNAQILLILNREFNMDILALHELEVDIYINIVKKFLKDWPEWVIFDQVINRLKKESAQAEIKNILEQKYKHLKEYLKSMIEMAAPLAQETIKKLELKKSKKTEPENNIVLEIYCTRRALNNFIYNQPNPAENDSLFHLMEFKPYELNHETPQLTFSSILHWYGVQLSIELPTFLYTRYTTHQLKHVLVNEINGPRKLNTELDTSIYINTSKNNSNSILISKIFTHLDKILHNYRTKFEYPMIEEIFNVIKSDLVLNSTTVQVPGMYKQHLNKYPYVRKLYKEVNGTTKDNIYIEETITPIQDWSLRKYVDCSFSFIPELQSWLKLECGECEQKFYGEEILTLLRDHFRVFHSDEPDWSCTNCGKTFQMANLTELGWTHECTERT